MFQPLPNFLGAAKDDSLLSAAEEGYYADSNQIRAVRGKCETVGGCEVAISASSSIQTLTGVCRQIWAWRDNLGNPYAAFGTNTNVYGYNDSFLYDITPIIAATQNTSVTLTTNYTGISTLTEIGITAHGLIAGQEIVVSYQSAAVGGVTLSGTYVVQTVVSTAAFTVNTTAGTTATGTVIFNYFTLLAPGNVSSLGGLGFGTGGYSVGNWGVPGTGIAYLASWSLDNWGANLFASPRGGGIYEFAWNITPTELTTNGSFIGGTTGWTLGSGWAYGTNDVVATSCSAALSQNVVTAAAGHYLLQLQVSSYSAGTLQCSLGGINIGAAISANGYYEFQFFAAAGTLSLAFTGAGLSATVSAFNATQCISLQQMVNLDLVPNAPLQNTCMWITAEQICMVGGSIDPGTNLFNPLIVRWSDRGYNTAQSLPGNQIWTASASVLAGFFYLAKGSRIVCAKNVPGGSLILTDTAAYFSQFNVGDPTSPYTFTLIGEGCGGIGANCLTVVNGIAYWMAPSGQFFSWSGSAPTPVINSNREDMFTNISFVQQDKIFAYRTAAFNEVGWLYPDQRDMSNECSRYQICDTTESDKNGNPVWFPGKYVRTARLDAGIFEYPFSTDASGNVYFEEIGQTINGSPINWYLNTGIIQNGKGDNLYELNNVIMDFQRLVGGVSVTVNAFMYPSENPIVLGPFTATASTTKIDLTVVARGIQLQLSSAATPASMRTGASSLDVVDTGQSY